MVGGFGFILAAAFLLLLIGVVVGVKVHGNGPTIINNYAPSAEATASAGGGSSSSGAGGLLGLLFMAILSVMVVGSIASTRADEAVPQNQPVSVPQEQPVSVPTVAPTSIPTVAPTSIPTVAPTALPEAPPIYIPVPAPDYTPVVVGAFALGAFVLALVSLRRLHRLAVERTAIPVDVDSIFGKAVSETRR